jgi:hypothetical protein
VVAGGTLIAGASARGALIGVTQNAVPNESTVPPQIESTPFGEEVFAYVDRTHELTAARTDPTTGSLTTANTGNLVPIPSYLVGAQYVANANVNRIAGTDAASNDYRVTYTVDSPGKAYLLLDNRLDGTASNATSSPNTTDPDLGGNLAWVLNEGWVRKNTGIFPNGQADYIGIDEGATVASPDLRTHTASGNVAGSGQGLNQFFAIYERSIPAAGTFTTSGIKQGTGAGDMYVVAFVSAPEPSAIAGLAGAALFGLSRRRRRDRSAAAR